MRYEEALKQVFTRRNCGYYDGSGSWPPCCTECACVEDAKKLVAAAVEKKDEK